MSILLFTWAVLLIPDRNYRFKKACFILRHAPLLCWGSFYLTSFYAQAKHGTDPKLENKKVHFNYEILERFQAGLEIVGHEVKALRGKMGGLDGAYVTVRGGEAYLINSFIPPYQVANTDEAMKKIRL